MGEQVHKTRLCVEAGGPGPPPLGRFWGSEARGPLAFQHSLASAAFLIPGAGEPVLQGWLEEPLGEFFAASALSSCQ